MLGTGARNKEEIWPLSMINMKTVGSVDDCLQTFLSIYLEAKSFLFQTL